MQSPRVSIIIPTYNRSWGLRRAVESALAQTFSNLEVIIVDDCSPDDTEAVARRFDDPRLRYLRQPHNVGMVANWGQGVALARGRYLVFLADDDLLHPTFVASRVAVLDERADVITVFSQYEVRTVKGELCRTVNQDVSTARDFGGIDLLTACFFRWFIGATMYRTADVQALWQDLCRDDLVLDNGLNLRLVLWHHGTAVCLPATDFIMTSHPGQNTCTKSEQVRQQKSQLLQRLLRRDLPAAYRKALLSELYHWHLTCGYANLRDLRCREAQRQFWSAALLRPALRHAWVGLVRSLFASARLTVG